MKIIKTITLLITSITLLWMFFTTAQGSQLPNPVMPEVKSVKVFKTGNVVLRWRSPPEELEYRVYRSRQKNNGFRKIGSVCTGAQNYYKDKTAVEPGNYYYRIRAVKTSGKRKITGRCTKTFQVRTFGKRKILSQDAFAKAIAKLNRQNISSSYVSKENGNKNAMNGFRKKETDVFSNARLLVKGKNSRLSFTEEDLQMILQGPNNMYVLQFTSSQKAKAAYGRLKKNASVIFVEPDASVVSLID